VYSVINDDLKSREFFTKNTHLIAGKEAINEVLNEVVFSLKPDAFFQLNTKQADVLYNKVIELGKFKKTDIVIYEGATTVVGTQEVTASEAVATISAAGIATFGLTPATGKDSLAKVVGLVDGALTTAGKTAFFTYDSTAYMFINDDTNGDTVIKLTGLNLDAMSLSFAQANTTATGITGFGA
jgi:hypothetical protein